MKKSLVKSVAIVLASVFVTATAMIGGTIAYLQDTDSDVNVMTVGSVYIKQIELERVEQTDSGDDKLKDFEQSKPLYPATGNIEWSDASQKWTTGGSSKLFTSALKNVQDKFVFVQNTGKSDAYVRTWFAFEAGSMNAIDINNKLIHWNRNTNHWQWTDFDEDMTATIDGEKYYLRVATYLGNAGTDNSEHKNGILSSGETTRPSLLQVFLDKNAGNELCDSFGKTYDILVFSQAVQTAGFKNADEALDTAFGKKTADNHPFENRKIYTAEKLIEAITNGEPVELGAKIEIPADLAPIKITKDTTINGNGFAITRADGYTGTIITVSAGATLTVNNTVIDGGAKWTGAVDPTLKRGELNSGVTATGNIISTEGNGSIILDEGTVIQNNVGSHAISLATRGGGSLTVNNAKIINNSSDSGAIWGGGLITINDGALISGNSSTGLAGVIRMVGSCNMEMNGGEICNNKANGDGGVIWGYGSSKYTFNGGKINNNESLRTGGVIYTGTYSTINISGSFEMQGNKAANSGAIRLTDHTSLTMTGGKISNNTDDNGSNCFNTWNNSITITGGYIGDNFNYTGGLGLTIGSADIDGVIHYNLSTNHNTAYLNADFEGFRFTVNESNANFANFNFKPASGYTYTVGDEDKLICMNAGYTTYWDTTTSTFRLKAN